MIPPQPAPLNWTAIGVVSLAVINITGWFVFHFLAKRRERQRDIEAATREITTAKEKRKREFLSFLSHWKSDISITVANAGDFFERLYKNRVPEFYALTTGIGDDFGARKPEFERLTSRLGGLKQEDLKGHPKMPKETVLEAIGELVGFINAV